MTSPVQTLRRHDLDWLRVCAFALLILYHTGMFYVTWDWHVKSPHASPALEPLMRLSSPWRLGLLFLISGAATRFMADKLSPAGLATDRFHRLFWPLLFGMFVIVPPQAYLEIVEKIGWNGGFAGFYRLYVQGHDGWCRGDDCLIVPTWNHLWFIAYALVYALLLAALLAVRPRAFQPRIPAGISAPLFLVGPWLWLWAMRVLLLPRFGSTHALVDDWYNHAIYLPLFLLGFSIARNERIADLTDKVRWPALAAALAAYTAVLLLPDGGEPDGAALVAARGLRELQAWGAILACLGFARHHLAGSGGPTLQWLTRAIFPFYIVHQTIIVVAGHHLARVGLPLALEGTLLVLVTATGCLLAAMAAMRWAPLGVVLGVPHRARPTPALSRPRA
jgi:surface polysaccharide O-acyltransferase-like enzyme